MKHNIAYNNSKVNSNLVIVLPALNESEGMERVLDEIFRVFEGRNYNVVVVDGLSTDNTREIAEKKGAIVIDQYGRGYGDALISGFQYAKEILNADLIAMMDADLTYDPIDIISCVELIENGKAELVVGNRFSGMQKGAMPFMNKFGNKVISWFAQRFLRIKIKDTQCGLRVFKAALVDRLDMHETGMPFAIEMLSEAKFAGVNMLDIPVNYRSRIGTPKLSPFRDGLLILGTIIRLARDTQPLLFFSSIGVLLGLVGIYLGVDVTFEWFRTGTIGRLPTVILSVLLMIGSLQFLTLGLVADMIKGLRKQLHRVQEKNRNTP